MAKESTTREVRFQNDILEQMFISGWLLGELNKHNKALALYPEDAIAFMADLQAEQNAIIGNFRIVCQEGFVR